MNRKIISAVLLSLIVLTGCSYEQSLTQQDEQSETDSDKTLDQKDGSSGEETLKSRASVLSEGTTNLSQTEGTVLIDRKGTYQLTGKGKTVIIDAGSQSVELELNNLILNSSDLPNLYVKDAKNVTLTLTGSNAMTCGNLPLDEDLNGALYAKSDMVFKGEGSLAVDSGFENALKIKGEAEFQSGTWAISSMGNGIRSGKTMQFKGGSYTIHAEEEGIESKGKMIIDDGTFVISSSDDCINASKSIEINGGTIQGVSAGNDGIDSNGDLIVNGGFVSIAGSSYPEHSFDTNGTPFEINGGKVIGIGGALVEPSAARQPVLLIGTDIRDISIVELRRDGQEPLVFELPEYDSTEACLILSDPSLREGEDVSIYVNDRKLDEVILNKEITYAGSKKLMKE